MPVRFGYYPDEHRSRNEPDRPPVPMDLLPGREPVKVEDPVIAEPEYSGLDLAAAAFRQGNLVSSTYDRLANYPLSFKDDPTFDPADHLDGFEDKWDRFVRVDSLEEMQFVKDKVRAEQADREVIQQAGPGGVVTLIGAGAVDPWTAASMLLPAVAPAAIGTKAAVLAGTATKLTRAQRVWAAMAANAALDTAGEAAMHSTQQLRTINDSLLTIGAGTLLTGAVGGIIASRMPKEEFEAIVRGLDETLPSAPPMRTDADSAGAARMGGNTSLEDEGIATPAGRFIARTFGKISPRSRTLLSPEKQTRQLMQEIGHVPYLIQKNLPVEQGGKGLPSEASIEDLVNLKKRTRDMAARTKLDAAFAQHKSNGGKLNHTEFSAAVSRELDGIPQPDAPEVGPVVQWARKEVFDEDRTRYREIPGEEEFGSDIDAANYFTHVYDRELIAREPLAFKEMLRKGFRENPLIPDEGAVAKEKLVAARREGVNDATINLEIAEREAKEALQAYDSVKAQLTAAEQAATGRGGAKNMAHRAKRTEQAKRREAAKLKRRLDKLEQQSQSVDDAVPPRPEPEIEAELATATARRKEVKASISGIKSVGRKTAEGTRKLAADLRSAKARATRLEEEVARLAEAGDAKALSKAEVAAKARAKADDLQTRLTVDREQLAGFQGQLNVAREELEKIADDIFDRRTELAVARSRGSKLDTLANRRGQALNRATDVTDELADAEALAKQLKQRAIAARKVVRSLKRPTKEARKAKIKAEYTARKAVIGQLDEAEMDKRVEDAYSHIMGDGDVLAPDGTSTSARSTKARKINLPSKMLDPWLVRDFEAVMSSYSRRMLPEIELKARYGSSTLSGQLSAIRESYARKINAASAAGDTKKVAALESRAKKDIEDIVTTLNRVAGRSNTHRQSSFVLKLIRAGRIFRTYQYISKLGNQAVSSISDSGKIVARFGLPKTVKALAQFLTDSNLRHLSLADTRRFGAAMQDVADFRVQQMAELGDELPIRRTDKMVAAAGNLFSRVTLMNKWNAMIQVGSASLEQDSIARKVAAGTLSAFDKANLQHAGLDATDMVRLKDMISRHAADDGLWRLRTELWEDQILAGKVERHIMGISDTMITLRNAADLPGLMDRELVKTWLQFRTFSLSSVEQTMIPMAQGLTLDTAKAAQGFATMLTLGGVGYYLREKIAGRIPDLSPGRLAAEAVNWSGLTAYFPDVWDFGSRLHDDIPTFGRFLSRSPWEAIGGPAVGTGSFAVGLLHKLFNGELEQADIHGIRRALPFQNLFYVSRLFNAIEGEVGEQLGAKDSNRMDFMDRLTHEIPSKEMKK